MDLFLVHVTVNCLVWSYYIYSSSPNISKSLNIQIWAISCFIIWCFLL